MLHVSTNMGCSVWQIRVWRTREEIQEMVDCLNWPWEFRTFLKNDKVFWKNIDIFTSGVTTQSRPLLTICLVLVSASAGILLAWPSSLGNHLLARREFDITVNMKHSVLFCAKTNTWIAEDWKLFNIHVCKAGSFAILIGHHWLVNQLVDQLTNCCSSSTNKSILWGCQLTSRDARH